jgi:para-nitrobenzyl esterase
MCSHHNHVRLIRTILIGLAVACIVTVASPASAERHSKVVVTDDGPVRGIATPAMDSFLGIPYAAAPVGDLRWRAPRPHARWHTPLDATRFGNRCPQNPDPFDNQGQGSVTEDCLFLNVYTPGDNDHDRWAHRHPVMVWIHGGSLVFGQSNTYVPPKLVGEGDVVVVTINYRLGYLGFLAHPALSSESPNYSSGNYGLMDQQLALRWVQRNIAHFGGDPDNVTIFGESAGGFSVHSQLASPLAAGLFHRAIVESGAYSLTQPTLADAEIAGDAFASLTGCGSQTAACLRALPVTTILAVESSSCCSPTVDGNVLPESVGVAFATGQFNQVPVIEGSNHDEWRLYVALNELYTGTPLTAAGYIPAIEATLGVSPALAAIIATVGYPLAAYPPPTTAPSIALGAVGTDVIFACNARLVSQSLAQFVPTYQYEFSDPNPPALLPPVSFPTGDYHATELAYLFDLTVVGAPALTASQAQLSDAMVRYWTHFAETGNPNSHHAPAWPRYGASDQFQSFAGTTPARESGFAVDHKCALWGFP